MNPESPGSRESCFDSRPAECVEQFNRIENKIDFLTTLMTGNKNPGVGVIVRLDRLEQRSNTMSWVLRAVAGTAITALTGLVIAMIYHFMGGSR